jgi:hypothetical protein
VWSELANRTLAGQDWNRAGIEYGHWVTGVNGLLVAFLDWGFAWSGIEEIRT